MKLFKKIIWAGLIFLGLSVLFIFWANFKIENDTVVKAYACGIKGTDRNVQAWVEISPGENNGVPFCVEGYTDGSLYQVNKQFITGPKLWNDESTSYSCDLFINSRNVKWIDCFGSVDASVSDVGFVYVDDENLGRECYVDNDGYAGCD